ncbi:hypothetical protein [Dyadobacter sp. LHD-138]|uniref:hypothetical protein n=1 Tax=Dyadobacter sp. LHD-138 TaxID=3071413 RepID=UPI0027E1CA0B|nr:hypothetical protein [Dyadobacter sp. LHD-138]MDQ6477847.1 hypothetical protein [Dyadobacter sp. LHD-138]
MNLIEVFEIIKDINPSDLDLSYEVYFNPNKNENRYQISPIKNVQYYINIIGKTGLFDDQIGTIKHSILYTTDTDSIDTSIAEADNLKAILTNLKSTVFAFKTYLENNINLDEGSSIRIKLPAADDFDELGKYINDLKRSISLPIRLDGIDGDIKILRGEPGSIWLVVLVVGQRALKLIAELCWSAAVVRRKHLEADIMVQQLRELKLSNDMREAVINAQKLAINTLIDAEASAVMHSFDIPSKNESLEHLKLSIKTLDELMSKGAEFRPALNMEESVSTLFPTKENTPLIQSRINQISEGEKQ